MSKTNVRITTSLPIFLYIYTRLFFFFFQRYLFHSLKKLSAIRNFLFVSEKAISIYSLPPKVPLEMLNIRIQKYFIQHWFFFYSLDGLCFERLVKEIHVRFRSQNEQITEKHFKNEIWRAGCRSDQCGILIFLIFCPAPIHLSFFGLFRLLKLSTWIRLLHYALTKKRNKKVPKEL